MFFQTKKIESTMVDREGKLSMTSLFDLTQDIAAAGSESIGNGIGELAARGLMWVIMKQHVEIARLPLLDEEITLCTYPGKLDHFVYYRHVLATDKNGEILFRCVSMWAILHKGTRAIALPRRSGIQPHEERGEGQIEAIEPIRIDGFREFEKRTVRSSDVDMNGHLNNVRYVAYFLDTMDSVTLSRKKIKSLQFEYMHEVLEGEEITVSVSDAEPSSYSCQGSVGGKVMFVGKMDFAD